MLHRKVLLSLVSFLLVRSAHATPTWAAKPSALDAWDVATVELKEVPDQGPMQILLDNDCSRAIRPALAIDPTTITLDQIINIGQMIWKVIDAGKPVVNVGPAPQAAALPKGLGCWSDLAGWHAPVARSFEASYKNLFGSEVVKFRFRLQFTYGGGKSGVGQYLANVTVVPADLNVSWGYTFNADVVVGQAVNVGTATNPVAGLELDLKWNVKTVFKESQSSIQIFVQGDGVAQSNN